MTSPTPDRLDHLTAVLRRNEYLAVLWFLVWSFEGLDQLAGVVYGVAINIVIVIHIDILADVQPSANAPCVGGDVR
jgi:hypothetical protein